MTKQRIRAGGRILRCQNTGMSPGGNPLWRCADCGASCHGFSPENICWCGQHFKNDPPGMGAFRCMPFSAILEHPELEANFLSCGCDPKSGRSEVGIISVSKL